MKPHCLLPFVAGLALLLTGANAAPVGHLTAASVEVTGPSTTTADLAGLLVRYTTTPTFTLDADHLTVERHRANASVVVEGRYNVNDSPRIIHDGPGLLVGRALRPLGDLWVLPLDDHDLPTLTASARDCVTLEPPEKDAATARAHVNSRQPEWSIDTSEASGAAAWRTCQDANATIEGDFLFVLWEWDSVLTANGEARALRTGHQDAAHSGTPLDGTLGTADELFITVRGGVLTLPLVPGAHELYLRAPHVEGGSWRFTDAAGTLPGVGDVAGAVHAVGYLAATVTGTGAGGPLGADVEGQPERVEVDGEPVAVTVPAVPGTSRISVTAWLAVGVVVVGAGAAWAWRLRRSGRSCENAPAAPRAGPAVPAAGGAVEPERQDVAAERAVLCVVEVSPGLTLRELQQRSEVSKERTAAAVDALLARGAVARRGSPSRWHFFPPWTDLDARWRREVALRQEANRLLLAVLRDVPGGIEQPRLVALCRQRWKWAPTTTKDRLRRLAAAGLAEATESVPVTESVPGGTLSVTWRPVLPTV